jgi:hypothetical protein
MYTCKRWVGCEAAIAGKPAPTVLIDVHLLKIGRLSGRHRGQAQLPQWIDVHLQEMGWLSGRHREQARLLQF